MQKVHRQYVATLAWAIWFGGLTFYAAVVVPTGTKVLGVSEQGFVTQQVTQWLNLIGAGALAILLWNTVAQPSKLLLITWIVLAFLQLALFGLHWQLDGLLDSQARELIDPERFSGLHELYEFTSALQWLAGLAHLWYVLKRT